MENRGARLVGLSPTDRSDLPNPDPSWSRVEILRSPILLNAYRLRARDRPFELWCCRTEDVPDLALADPQNTGLLSLDEQQRWQQLRFEKDRRLFLTTRLLVRCVLSQYADLRPAEWHFVKNAFGRPAIAPDIAARIEAETGRPPVNFNLSRSGSLAVCAMAQTGRIGVDVEDEHRSFAVMEIAPAILAPSELTELTRAAEPERSVTFLKHWVLKEAFVKACGQGLTLEVNRIRFTGIASPHPQLEFASVPGQVSPPWRFEMLHLFHRYRVAVAYRPDPGAP